MIEIAPVRASERPFSQFTTQPTHGADTIRELRRSDGTHIMLTPRGQEIMHAAGCATVRHLITAAIESTLQDPFARSIDEFENTEAGRWARTVNRLPEEAEAILGTPVAMKGTGLNMRAAFQRLTGPRRVDLATQFRCMSVLAGAQQAKHPDGIKGQLFINQPYAYISHHVPGRGGDLPDYQEWLLMERVVDGQSVDEYPVAVDEGRMSMGFNRKRYPALAAFAGSGVLFDGRSVDFRDLQESLAGALHPDIPSHYLGDVVGHNILEHTDTTGNTRYTFIDLQPRRRM